MTKTSVLLPDETHCRSELGAILYRDRKTFSFSAEVTDIREPTTYFGHVEYTIVIQMNPVEVYNYEKRMFELKTRFRELNKLYQNLSTIHKQLYLKDVFPEFAPAKLLGSTTAETIEERRRATEQFLNFVLQSGVLCKARVFQSFIEQAKEHTPQKPESATESRQTDEPSSQSGDIELD